MNTPTPIRTRHEPTPRDPSIPKTMRVTVEVGFVQSCPDCRRIVAGLASSCISDSTVGSFKAVPGSKHAHEVTEGAQSLPGLTAATPEAISDTNGSDPEAVFAALEDGFLLADAQPGRINGFDPEGRD